ncbi:MAG: hypothetical protein ACOC78_02580 [Actinomycetota bacterium]
MNPAKISGVCGRLMCCLRYEQEAYRRFILRVPAIGETVETERGMARVVSHEVLEETVVLELEDGGRFSLPADYFGPEPEEIEIEAEETEDEVVEDKDEELEEG